MGVTAALDLHQARAAAERAEHDNLEMLARSSGARVDQLLGDTRRVVTQIARDAEVAAYLEAAPEARAPLAATVQRTLDNVAGDDLSLAFLLDARGVCVTSTRAEEIGLDYTDREYYQGALRGGDFVSELRTGVTTKRPGVYFSHVVEAADHRVVGVAVIKLAGEALARMVESVHPPGGGALLVDGWGVVISHSDHALLYKSLAPLPPSVLALPSFEKRFVSVGVDRIESLGLDTLAARVASGTDGSTDFVSPGKGRMLAGFSPVKSKGWSLVVFEPEERLHAPLARVTTRTAFNALFVGGIVTLLALLLARTIVRPIRRLTDAARALRRGDYRGARVDEGSDDEIGALRAARSTPWPWASPSASACSRSSAASSPPRCARSSSPAGSSSAARPCARRCSSRTSAASPPWPRRWIPTRSSRSSTSTSPR
jgi:C4-dicarboxylate-specific signal transduction histidine kinase